MTKEIYVNVGERETRIAVTEDNKLVELHIERAERVVGSLYKCRVANVLQGMDAAFVDIGLERNAFLYVGDVLPTVDDLTSESSGTVKATSEPETTRRAASGRRRKKGESAVASSVPAEAESLEESETGLVEEALLVEFGEEEEELEAAAEDEPETGDDSTGEKLAARPRRGGYRRSMLRQQRIKDVLHVGQELLVQVIKGPRSTKGARVSTRISLPGRYLVLMPEGDTLGVSRKIEDSKERDRLKKLGDRLRDWALG